MNCLSSPLMGEVSAKRAEWVTARHLRNHPLSHRATRADSSPIKGEHEESYIRTLSASAPKSCRAFCVSNSSVRTTYVYASRHAPPETAKPSCASAT